MFEIGDRVKRSELYLSTIQKQSAFNEYAQRRITSIGFAGSWDQRAVIGTA